MKNSPKSLYGEVYLPATIPDDTEDLIKSFQKSQNKLRESYLADQRKSEEKKVDRIIVSKEDKRLHATNLILEYAENAKSVRNLENGNDPTTFTIANYYFNFEDTSLLTSFFDKLIFDKCIAGWKTNPYKDVYNVDFIFTGVNIIKLEKLQKMLNRQLTNSDREWTKKELKKELFIIKRNVDLTNTEERLLDILFDGEPHSLEELVKKNVSKNRGSLKQVKSQTNKKLSDTGWKIDHWGSIFSKNFSYKIIADPIIA